ncbi:MAG TPA: hypothetical protein VMS86_11795 [Thermoanaerobaculia bacterium]|nr:hypothetical protein [Thermoanaerobaculia bacterium]
MHAGLLAAALALSTAWLHGCGGDITADQRTARRGEGDESAIEASREGRRSDGGSFFDRLLGSPTRELTVPPGTVVQLRFSETVSSRSSATGAAFRTTVDEDVVIEDAIVIPAGSVVIGRVTEAHQPQGVGGRARLSLEFTALELPSGESAPIDAVFARRGRSENLKDAAIIAGSTLAGVVLGEEIDKGEGGVVGGILGGIGGAVAASKTKGKPVEIPAGTVMAVELVRPVTLEVPA